MRFLSLSLVCFCCSAWHFTSKTMYRAVARGNALSQRNPHFRTSLQANKQSLEEVIYNPPDYLLRLVDLFPGRRLSIADVVAGSGKTFYSARRDLMALATLTNAALEVTNDGEIFYIFPTDTRSIVQKKSITRQMQMLYEKCYPLLNFTFRTSFGVFLVLSLVVVALGMASLSAGGGSNSDSSFDDTKRERRSMARLTVSLSDVLDIYDLNRLTYQRQLQGQYTENSNMSFLEACYSFIFGDGDPNKDYPIALTVQAADYIRKNKGVVVAEELAPFILNPPELPPEKSQSSTGLSWEGRVEESYLLPLVLQLNGNPIVTEQGHIVYYFEELMKSPNLPSSYLPYPPVYSPSQPQPQPQPSNTVSTSPTMQPSKQSAEPLAPLEALPVFSHASAKQLASVALLGVGNIIGVVALGSELMQQTRTLRRGGEMVMMLRGIYPPLALYAIGFLAFPLARYIYQETKIKPKVQERNDRRMKWMQRLRNPLAGVLKEKLEDKEKWAEKIKEQESKGNDEIIVFRTTDSPALREEEFN